MNVTRRRDALVLLFFLCFFVLLASGRIASYDAGQQLQVSMLLALTGSMSDDGRPGGPATQGWVEGPNGRLYQPHDIGNVILMLPSAWIGGHLSRAPTAAKVLDPPLLSRVAVSLTGASLSAVACFWLFRLFAISTGETRALLFSLAFPCTTIFLAYSRAAWDVLGACCLMCGVLYYSAATLHGLDARRNAILMAALLAGVCSFRYSVAPFLTPAALYILLSARRTLEAVSKPSVASGFSRGPRRAFCARWGGSRTVAVLKPRLDTRTMILAGVTFGLLMVPSFLYNLIRTGSPLRPATATAKYLAGPNGLTGNMAHGLYGLIASPNRGIFLFSPVLLIVLSLPFVWPRLTIEQRRLIAAYGTGSACYVLLISKVLNWGAFGWGPRYLVPILPVLFVSAALAFMHAGKHARVAFIGLAALSAVLTFPTALVNWHLATTTWVEATNPDAAGPYQQYAAWKALALGLKGESLPVPANASGDELRATTATFPDLLLARIARLSRAGFVVALSFMAVAVSVAAFSFKRLMAASP